MQKNSSYSSLADASLPQLLIRLWAHLSHRRQLQLGGLMLVMLLSSGAEVLSLAAVLPFLAVLANPTALWEQPLLKQLAPLLGISNPQDFLLPITVAFALAALSAGSIRLLNLWLSGRLAAAIGSDLSIEAYRRTLYQPYSVHVARNSSQVISSISGDVARVVGLILGPLLLSLSSGLIALSLIVTLLLIRWKVALGSGLVVCLVYAIAMVAGRSPLKQMDRDTVVYSRRVLKSLQEGLAAIREVLLDSSQSYFLQTYRDADRKLRRNGADTSFLSTYPRLVLEPVGMAMIAIVGLVLVKQQGVGTALPLLGALALGSQKLLPMVQKVYEGWAQSRHSTASLRNVLDLISQPLPITDGYDQVEPLILNQSIRFVDVHFSYSPDLPEVLRGIDLEVCRGERIGLVGTTGSGKSTTIDLLMGLLNPTSGKILVDGSDLNDPHNPALIIDWRAAIAHVPQNIYLTDSSISENIAFGVPHHKIDHSKVRQAAQQSQISNFIDSLPEGYDSFVGERGIRLSGGQRQRIGIARALYKQASVLVFDEATSALDTTTENAVMQAIEGLSRDLTIVIIAHRLTTLERCDRVIRLDHGLVQDSTCYHQG